MVRRGTIACVVLLAAMSAGDAKPFHYVNARFGTSCTIPDEVFSERQPEPDNGDGQKWLAPDGASVSCSGINNNSGQTAKSFVETELALQDDDYVISYSKAGKDWAVLSGLVQGQVFYERRLFGRSGFVHTVWIQYSPDLKAKYDPLVADIAGSLKGK